MAAPRKTVSVPVTAGLVSFTALVICISSLSMRIMPVRDVPPGDILLYVFPLELKPHIDVCSLAVVVVKARTSFTRTLVVAAVRAVNTVGRAYVFAPNV